MRRGLATLGLLAAATLLAMVGSESVVDRQIVNAGGDGGAAGPGAGAVTTTLPLPPAFPSTPTTPTTPPHRSLVATVKGPSIEVFDAPDAGVPASRTFPNPRASGAEQVFLIIGEQGDWLDVMLPVRPNGSTGWIRTDDVSIAGHDYRIVVELGAHQLTVFKGDEVFHQESVGVGVANTPTPGGLFYTVELFASQKAAYGPYAYGLSGYSEVLYDFAGGDGQFGIHGTNDPSGLGSDVSNGCIRMSNEGITRLAEVLPIGVPVEIRA
jgi:lipoprotein-anchoring transpeptidase ErfK/SrfK